MSETPLTPTDRAAQIWSKPGLTDRVMDPKLCEAIVNEITCAEQRGGARAYQSTIKFAETRQRMQKDAGCECGRKEWTGFLNVYRIKAAQAEKEAV